MTYTKDQLLKENRRLKGRVARYEKSTLHQVLKDLESLKSDLGENTTYCDMQIERVEKEFPRVMRALDSHLIDYHGKP